jgi:hypothetical protein
MATKKAPAKKVEVAPQEIKTADVPSTFTAKQVKPTWEIKDRLYTLKNNKRPLVFTIPTKHTGKRPLLWFDEKQGYQRELKYATNQRSPFVDEQSGPVTLGRIVMREGMLRVPKENQSLQKLLSLYHPYRDEVYEEYKPQEQAVSQLDWIEAEIEALNLAKALSIDELEAILRVEFGNKVNDLSSNELKRDGLIFAKRNPVLFVELANDDNVQLRNFGIKAVEYKIIKLSPDQRTFTYGDGNRKLMTIPFDENPYSALAAWFKTDEGVEVYKAIQKRL